MLREHLFLFSCTVKCYPRSVMTIALITPGSGQWGENILSRKNKNKIKNSLSLFFQF